MKVFCGSTAALLALTACAVMVSCGSSHERVGFGDAGPGAGGDATTGDDSGTVLVGDSGGEGGCSQYHCSADLHDVLDCNGNVVQHCPDDQGCGGSGCVPACAAATANKSTFGCDYYAVDPDIIPEGVGACFAAFVANTWTTPVTLTADWAGQPLDIATSAYIPQGSGSSLTYKPLANGQLAPGQIAMVFFNRYGSSGGIGIFNFNCPAGVTPAVTTQDGAVHGTALGHAFHLTSDRPVVAYDMFPFGGGQSAATSATLLVPTSAWDTNYVGVNAYAKDQVVPEAQPFLEIVASQDNTNVTISPTAAIAGGNGVAATGKGQPMTYVLNKGQVLQFTQDAELTGSPILSDKPIGVWGGATCLNIDVNDTACDSAHQQLFPVKALGHEYVAVRYRDRFPNANESTPWRIVGAVDGTTLTYEPSTPNGAPTTLALGQVATFWTAAPFVVKSQDDQHPFYISAHMTGASRADATGNDARGDPEFVNVIPPQEYLADYVFFTDPTYSETNLVVVRTKGPSGFADVNLDCAGNLTGWLPVGTSGQYEYTRVDLVTGNFQPVGQCNNGRHEIKSTLPFGLTVWGWGSAATTGFYTQWVSYAYPAGASVQPINTVVVPPAPM